MEEKEKDAFLRGVAFVLCLPCAALLKSIGQDPKPFVREYFEMVEKVIKEVKEHGKTKVEEEACQG